TARGFRQSLPYFQTEGKFDEQRYKTMLGSQKISSGEFVNRIKNALIMEQFQRSIIDSSFATKYDVESFFKIQNQQRDVDYISVAVQKQAEQPAEQEVTAYYEHNQDVLQTPEQASVEYLELSLEEVAKTIAVTDEKLKVF
ncbi:MAG: SurA N-terminal domain-containing protein, partial [Candidatus Falkowbacteria bacterium]|nr:SurA N-terminal domain-containing protein [Candidatus Falkowbacteria bacterium]